MGERQHVWLERSQGLALLLPSVVLAWPGPGPFRDDFLPHATGAGVACLAAIPAAVLCALRPGATRPAAFLVLPLLGVAAACTAAGSTDSFETRRALLSFAASLALFFGGASLGPAGLRVFARGAIGVALLLLAFALADSADAFAGALGNSGSTAMAALPGALVGAALLATGRGPWRLAGGLAVALYLAYAVRVPVRAAEIAFACGAAVLAAARKGRPRLGLAFLALAATLCATIPIGRLPPSADPGSAADGGTEARWRIWSASLAMVGDHPWAGVGPGQFAATFPPYRDPREIEISSHGRKIAAETEVEHPHEDWLLPVLELGIPIGLAWIAFLASVAVGAWRAMRGDDPDRCALGAASIGILAYALVHAPLSHVPAAASIAFAAFGAVLARPGRLRTWPLVVQHAALAPLAFAYARHGSRLASLAGSEVRDAREVERTLESALNCCHDSPLATAMLARLHEDKGSDPETVVRLWTGVLLGRPHNVEALMQLGLALARSGDLADARAAYEWARALDRDHPGIARNLRLLDLQEGRLDDPHAPRPEECFARSRRERQGGDLVLADFLEARAHLLWAREHAEAGRYGDAVRSYRQCVRVTLNHIDGGAVRVRLELGAALLADGRTAEAREELQAIHAGEDDLASLPAWAAEKLRAAAAGE